LRARRSEAAAGHRISKPHPASTYRYEPVSYYDYHLIQFRYIFSLVYLYLLHC